MRKPARAFHLPDGAPPRRGGWVLLLEAQSKPMLQGDRRMKTNMRSISFLATLAFLVTLLSMTACKQGPNAPVGEKSAPQQLPVLPTAPGSAPDLSNPPSQAAGVAWTVPA